MNKSNLMITLIVALNFGLPLHASASPNESKAAIERPPIILGQGEQRILHFSGLTRYSLGGTIARATPLPSSSKATTNTESSILIKGVAPGFSDLWVWKSDSSTEHRTIRVEALNKNQLNAPLETALGQLEETEIIRAGNTVILRGPVSTPDEAKKIAVTTKAFPDTVRNETELTDTLLTQYLKKLTDWLTLTGNPHKLTVTKEDNWLKITGAVSNPSEAKELRERITSFCPFARISLEEMPDNAPTIHFKVYLLEVKKSRINSLGLRWPAVQEGAFRVTTSNITDALQLDVALQALESEGSGRLLSQPEMVVRAPGEAELFAGGELPIMRSTSRYNSQVYWKPYGLTLKLKVTHATKQQARLDVETEVSHLDYRIGTDEVPGLQTNRLKTQIDAHFGSPLFLSGLIQDETREQARGLPLLSQLPVLGALFGSDDFINDRSELVAILLPRTSPPPAPLERVTRISPRGKTPPPRNWHSPDEEISLRASSDFPWNALK